MLPRCTWAALVFGAVASPGVPISQPRICTWRAARGPSTILLAAAQLPAAQVHESPLSSQALFLAPHMHNRINSCSVNSPCLFPSPKATPPPTGGGDAHGDGAAARLLPQPCSFAHGERSCGVSYKLVWTEGGMHIYHLGHGSKDSIQASYLELGQLN